MSIRHEIFELELRYYLGIVVMFIVATGVISIPFFMFQAEKDYDHIEQGYIIAKQQEIVDDNTIHYLFKLRHRDNVFVSKVVFVSEADYKSANINDLYNYDNEENKGMVVILTNTNNVYALVYQTKTGVQYEVRLSEEEYSKYKIGDQYQLQANSIVHKYERGSKNDK